MQTRTRRIYDIEGWSEQTLILVHPDRSVSRRIYRGEFGGMGWHQIDRRQAAALLQEARRHPEANVYLQYAAAKPDVEECCFQHCFKPASVKVGGDVYFPMCAEHAALVRP